MSRTEVDWADLRRQVFDKLDIAAEFEDLGVKISVISEDHAGWLACHAIDREDRNPSCGINVGRGELRGLYHDFADATLNTNLLDFAVKSGRFKDWTTAFRFYAEKARVELPRGLESPKKVGDALDFQDWQPNFATSWCLNHKKGISPEGLKLCGGKMAKWKTRKREYPVIALPIWGKALTKGEPSGWVIWDRTGADLPVFTGKGQPPRMSKMLSVRGSRSGLMGDWALSHLESAEVVWKTEGPTDMMALTGAIPTDQRDKHVALTNSGGCGERPRAELIENFSGKVVYVIHDTDEKQQGEKSAPMWCNEIARYAKEVRNVKVPGGHKDVRKAIAEGVTYDQFLAAAAEAPIVEHDPDFFNKLAEAKREQKRREIPPPAPPGRRPIGDTEVPFDDDSNGGDDDAETSSESSSEPASSDSAGTYYEERALEAVGLDVLGEMENGKIKVFSIHHHKSEVIPDISRLSYDRLLQICGDPAKQNMHKGTEDLRSEGYHNLTQVREAIALMAGYRRINKDSLAGIGSWRGRGKDDQITDAVVLVNGNEAARLNGDGILKRVMVPRCDNLLLEFSGAGDNWYDFEKLRGYVDLAHKDPEWVKKAVDEATALFDKWKWSNQHIDPMICTGLVLSSWVQTLWAFRPMVSITGGSNTGKTTLFQCLETMFGGLGLLSSHSSEAGLRQAIRTSAPVALCDEFEDSHHRAKVLELLRTSSRGTKIYRGNTGHGGEQFGLQHIVWVAAIEIGLKREPDRNRFIGLELLKPSDEEYGKLHLPPDSEIEDLGQRLLAIAITKVRKAADLASRLKSCKHEGIDKRVIETYTVPAAILATIYDYDDEAADHLLGTLLSGVERLTQGKGDDVELMDDILSGWVDVGRGSKCSVSQIIGSQDVFTSHKDALEMHGITVTSGCQGDSRGPWNSATGKLFLDQKVVCRSLLKGTQWQNQDIAQILLRIEGAKRGKCRLLGHGRNGINIPFEMVKASYLSKSTHSSRSSLLSNAEMAEAVVF